MSRGTVGINRSNDFVKIVSTHAHFDILADTKLIEIIELCVCNILVALMDSESIATEPNVSDEDRIATSVAKGSARASRSCLIALG